MPAESFSAAESSRQCTVTVGPHIQHGQATQHPILLVAGTTAASVTNTTRRQHRCTSSHVGHHLRWQNLTHVQDKQDASKGFPCWMPCPDSTWQCIPCAPSCPTVRTLGAPRLRAAGRLGLPAWDGHPPAVHRPAPRTHHCTKHHHY
jgi:hypothetical protein